MPRKKGKRTYTEEDYSRLYSRIEKEIDIEDYDSESIKELIKNKAYNNLKEDTRKELMRIERIRDEIEETTKFQELERLDREVRLLPMYKPELSSLVLERRINLSVSVIGDFAREKGINISEKVVGKLERWKNKNVIVIRDRGRFKSWKRI